MSTTEQKVRNADLKFIQEMLRQPLLEKEQELGLVHLWKDTHDENAMHQVVKPFARLVISTAIHFRHYGIPFVDLVQEGIVGLMHAIKRFDPNRESRFSTYAKLWVRALIKEHILRNWSVVRTGTTSAQKQLFFSLKRLHAQINNFSYDAMNEAEKKQFAETLHTSISDLDEMEKRIVGHDYSLNATINETDNVTWQETIADDHLNPEDLLSLHEDEKNQKKWLSVALNELNDRERFVIVKRRLADAPLTLERIGDILHISKERARQLEAQAFLKMKKNLTRYLSQIKDSFVHN